MLGEMPKRSLHRKSHLSPELVKALLDMIDTYAGLSEDCAVAAYIFDPKVEALSNQVDRARQLIVNSLNKRAE